MGPAVLQVLEAALDLRTNGALRAAMAARGVQPWGVLQALAAAPPIHAHAPMVHPPPMPPYAAAPQYGGVPAVPQLPAPYIPAAPAPHGAAQLASMQLAHPAYDMPMNAAHPLAQPAAPSMGYPVPAPFPPVVAASGHMPAPAVPSIAPGTPARAAAPAAEPAAARAAAVRAGVAARVKPEGAGAPAAREAPRQEAAASVRVKPEAGAAAAAARAAQPAAVKPESQAPAAAGPAPQPQKAPPAAAAAAANAGCKEEGGGGVPMQAFPAGNVMAGGVYEVVLDDEEALQVTGSACAIVLLQHRAVLTHKRSTAGHAASDRKRDRACLHLRLGGAGGPPPHGWGA